MNDDIDPNTFREILRVLYRKIARRSSEEYAINLLSESLEKLRSKYEFLKYICINQSLYSEGETIIINPELNSIEKERIFSAINELMNLCVKEMREKADFFFIREFQEAFEDVDHIRHSVEMNLKLNQMQHDYIIKRTQIFDIQKDLIFADVLKGLLYTVNKHLPEKQSVDLLKSTLVALSSKYNFLSSIDIIPDYEKKGYYIVNIEHQIRYVPLYDISESLESIIQNVGNTLKIPQSNIFLDTLKYKLGASTVSALRKLSIPIDSMQFKSTNIKNKDILKKIISSLVDLICSRTSELFAVAVMKHVIEDVGDSYRDIEYIHLLNADGSYEVEIEDAFDLVDDIVFVKIIKNIINAVGNHLNTKRIGFIQDLKILIGKEYVEYIEKLGLNFHMLEIKHN